MVKPADQSVQPTQTPEFYTYQDSRISVSLPVDLSRKGEKRWVFKADARKHRRSCIDEVLVLEQETDESFQGVVSFILGVQELRTHGSIGDVVKKGPTSWMDHGTAVLTTQSNKTNEAMTYRYDIAINAQSKIYVVCIKLHKNKPYLDLRQFEAACERICKSIAIGAAT